jgi:hypothetical protein
VATHRMNIHGSPGMGKEVNGDIVIIVIAFASGRLDDGTSGKFIGSPPVGCIKPLKRSSCGPCSFLQIPCHILH